MPLDDLGTYEALSVAERPTLDALPEVFSKFMYLERLYLHLEVHNGRACLADCGGGDRGQLDTQTAKTMIGNIFDACVLSRTHSPLEYVEIIINFTCRIKSRW